MDLKVKITVTDELTEEVIVSTAMLDLASGEISRVEAIVHSMTKAERAKPEIINGSRRARIAAGSGTTVQDRRRRTAVVDGARRRSAPGPRDAADRVRARDAEGSGGSPTLR